MTEITEDEAFDCIEGVLKAAGIKASIGAYYAYGKFHVEFPDGAYVAEDGSSFFIECDGIEHQRAK